MDCRDIKCVEGRDDTTRTSACKVLLKWATSNISENSLQKKKKKNGIDFKFFICRNRKALVFLSFPFAETECEAMIRSYLSSPQIRLTCKTGTTKEASRILAMTTASTIWFRCWFKPPEATTIRNLLFSFAMLAEALRYPMLKSKQGLYPSPSGCFQNSTSASERFPATPCAGNGTMTLVDRGLGSSSLSVAEREVKSMEDGDEGEVIGQGTW